MRFVFEGENAENLFRKWLWVVSTNDSDPKALPALFEAVDEVVEKAIVASFYDDAPKA